MYPATTESYSQTATMPFPILRQPHLRLKMPPSYAFSPSTRAILPDNDPVVLLSIDNLRYAYIYRITKGTIWEMTNIYFIVLMFITAYWHFWLPDERKHVHLKRNWLDILRIALQGVNIFSHLRVIGVLWYSPRSLEAALYALLILKALYAPNKHSHLPATIPGHRCNTENDSQKSYNFIPMA